jgi:hypothetical protein
MLRKLRELKDRGLLHALEAPKVKTASPLSTKPLTFCFTSLSYSRVSIPAFGDSLMSPVPLSSK